MTERQPLRRDVVDLKEHLEKYFESRLREMVRHYDYRLDQLEKSRNEQALQFDIRLQAIDEAQRTKFPTRDDMAQITERFASESGRFASDVQDLRESRAELRGKASQNSVVLAIMLASVALVIELAQLYF